MLNIIKLLVNLICDYVFRLGLKTVFQDRGTCGAQFTTVEVCKKS